MSAVSASSTSRQAAALLAIAAASTSSAAESTSAMAMDNESDDGEPRLEIVDEPMTVVDVKTEGEGGRVFPGKSFPPPAQHPNFRKSISYDGSESGAAATVARSMRSIVEETNANEAIESLLMLGREPVVSPQSREVT